MDNQKLINKINRIQEILIEEATGIAHNEDEYKKIRTELIRSSLKKNLPNFLIKYSDLNHFWTFIKNEFKTYQERRLYIWDGFTNVKFILESEQIYPSDKDNDINIKNLSPEYIYLEWQKALNRRNNDPEGAITSARTLIENVCKFILDSKKIKYSEKEDLPKLYKLASESLNLSPSQHSQPVFKQILSGCISTVNGLGSLRNKLSDSHGKGIIHIKPSLRHATLAVNISGSICTFMLETLEDSKK